MVHQEVEPSAGTTAALAFQWGLAGDVPVPGDYDGDGLSDVAVFRPSLGQWHIRQSATATLAMRALGTVNGRDRCRPTTTPMAGVDLAVYRPSDGLWYVTDLATGFATVRRPSGACRGDIPAVNVAIGNATAAASHAPPRVDGRKPDPRRRFRRRRAEADMSVYRPSTGAWYNLLLADRLHRRSSRRRSAAGSDTPVPGDYDGDGKSDLAVFTPATGGVVDCALTGGVTVEYQWGLNGDVPMPADYDGDGLHRSRRLPADRTGGGNPCGRARASPRMRPMQWGLNGDVPVPGDYDGDGVTDLAVFRPADWRVVCLELEQRASRRPSQYPMGT